MILTIECVELLQVETEVAIAALVVVFEGVDGVVEHHLGPVSIQHAELTTARKSHDSQCTHARTLACTHTLLHTYTHIHTCGYVTIQVTLQ